GTGQIIIRTLRFLPGKLWRQIAIWDLNGKIFSQTLLIAVISLSVMLIDSVHQIEKSIQAQLKMDDQKDIPAYFLFDIQDEQMDGLQTSVAEMGLKLIQPAPMVRAKLVSVNDALFERDLETDRFTTREEEEE